MASFVGYHGTKKSKVKEIEETNFKISDKMGWLGKGAYFFENDFQMAKDWAFYRYNASIEVIKVMIEVPTDKVFDISHPHNTDTRDFFKAREEIISIMVEQDLDLEEEKRMLDGKVLDYICELKNILLIRAFTYTYKDIDRINRLFSRFANGIELCVKHNEIIKSKTAKIG